jgi:hypothetical protein
MAQISNMQKASDCAIAALEKKFRASVSKARGALAIAEQATKSAQKDASLAVRALAAQGLGLDAERAEKIALKAQILDLEEALAAHRARIADLTGGGVAVPAHRLVAVPARRLRVLQHRWKQWCLIMRVS